MQDATLTMLVVHSNVACEDVANELARLSWGRKMDRWRRQFA